MESRPHPPARSLNRLVVVGGGLSGLAAAVTLVSRKFPVHLLEQKPTLGGRAYSFTENRTGDSVDNGQHLLIAGYDRTMAFLRTVGSIDLLSVQTRPSLSLHHPERGFRTFSAPLIPPPLNLAIGILRSNLIPVPDRFRALNAGRSILRCEKQELAPLTIAEWLDSCGQSAESRRCFWEPLSVSIMNEHTDRASALVFVGALRKAFLSSAKAAALAFPRVGLSELFVDSTRQFLSRHGAVVQCNADVSRVRITNGRVSGVVLRSGKTIQTDACILALPATNAAKLLPESLRQLLAPLCAPENPASPIVSIHLWFKHDFMDREFLGLIGRRIQWVFNRRKLTDARGPGGFVSAVISAAYEFVKLGNKELLRIAIEDLRSVYGQSVADPTNALVIREKKATVSLTPELEQVRPDAQTSIPNLFLAGDWTATGLPATIEGAIISGEKAGDLAMASCGRN